MDSPFRWNHEVGVIAAGGAKQVIPAIVPIENRMGSGVVEGWRNKVEAIGEHCNMHQDDTSEGLQRGALARVDIDRPIDAAFRLAIRFRPGTPARQGSTSQPPAIAVVLTARGALWQLRTRAASWSIERLAQAARLLDAERPGSDIEALQSQLAAALDLPDVVLLHSDPTQPRTIDWSIDSALPVSLAPPVQATLRQRLADALDTAVAELTALLNHDAVAASTRRDRFDGRLYNYLADAHHGRYRRQFAQAYTLAADAVAHASSDSTWHDVGALVDQGAPLLRDLSRRWHVQPTTIRLLLRAGVPLRNDQGHAQPRDVARMMNALRPEDRPAPTGEDWQQLARAIRLGWWLFRVPLWTSPLTLAWLRELARNRWQLLAEAEGNGRLGRNTVFELLQTRDAIVDLLDDHDDQAAALHARVRQRARLRLAVEQWLSERLSPPWFATMRRFIAAYEHEYSRLNRYWSRLQRRGPLRPLLPAALDVPDCSRTILPLASEAAFRHYGAALENCVGDTHLDQHLRACQSGDLYLVVLVDRCTRQPMAMASLSVREQPHPDDFGFTVWQFYAAGNTSPTANCERAMDALADYFSSPAVQAYVAGLRREARYRAWFLSGDAANLATERALRVTLPAEDCRRLWNVVAPFVRRCPPLFQSDLD